MTRRSLRIGVAVSSLVVAGGGAASAQTQTPGEPIEPLVFGSGATYEVRFDDDPLAALPNGAIIPRIHVLRGTRSARLHRPRTQFVAEMLKSADHF